MNKVWNGHDSFGCPCKDCPGRHAACHDDCVRFAEFQKARAEAVRNERYQRWLNRLGYMKRSKKR